MIPEEEILENIKEMGYVTLTPKAVNPSYYKLGDGTIVRALVNLNFMLADPNKPQGFSINSNNLVSAFVPKEKRRPELHQNYNPAELQSGIIDEDVDFEVLRENFSVYDLSNGLTMSVKTVVGQVKKTKYYSREGEPIYMINTNPIVKAKAIK